jgi:hypothetical protein
MCLPLWCLVYMYFFLVVYTVYDVRYAIVYKPKARRVYGLRGEYELASERRRRE